MTPEEPESNKEGELKFEFGVVCRSKKDLGFELKPERENEKNGDNFIALPKIGVFAVLDGVGKNEDPSQASTLAKYFLEARLKNAEGLGLKETIDFLKELGLAVDKFLYSLSNFKKKKYKLLENKSINTTLTLAKIWRDPNNPKDIKIITINAGDSRVYLADVGARKLEQLTTDNSEFVIPKDYAQNVLELEADAPDLKRIFDDATTAEELLWIQDWFVYMKKKYGLDFTFLPEMYFEHRNVITAYLGMGDGLEEELGVEVKNLSLEKEQKFKSSVSQVADNLLTKAREVALTYYSSDELCEERSKPDDMTSLVVDIKIGDVVIGRLALTSDGIHDNLTLKQMEEAVFGGTGLTK
ncbi:MAG: hypothetical protein COU31_04765 [Candidatus Magasanikbacteria bacterium CG10_big_fil_rev_8_21_14_0_10_40_10]|uniref:PPM-type phosphatase domain-containing protein n=1 Tax=Candidatus Magasanikbacteria bacterium CG10_big_fil_rev_8_21_14_0_10_40_10 TaxID=1974648 RepID=A0A2M6W2P2_9BACT|nr:MAG: hypothetical protein COU31_04765 [Candidatus Magasanikbacteria bacterium CG10_big_fil_rev_8_21_14_0_10_40_10]